MNQTVALKPNLKIYKENVVAIQTDISVTPEYKNFESQTCRSNKQKC